MEVYVPSLSLSLSCSVYAYITLVGATQIISWFFSYPISSKVVNKPFCVWLVFLSYSGYIRGKFQAFLYLIILTSDLGLNTTPIIRRGIETSRKLILHCNLDLELSLFACSEISSVWVSFKTWQLQQKFSFAQLQLGCEKNCKNRWEVVERMFETRTKVPKFFNVLRSQLTDSWHVEKPPVQIFNIKLKKI